MRAIGQPDRGRGAADLLHRHDMLGVAHAGAAILLLDRDAEDAEIAELAPQIGRKLVIAVDGRGTWGDLVVGEAADRAAQHLRRLATAEIQAEIGRASCRERVWQYV